MINYEQLIRNALEKIDASDAATRLRVYRSATNAFTKKFGGSEPEALAAQRALLATAIQNIEAEHAQKESAATAPAQSAQEPQQAPERQDSPAAVEAPALPEGGDRVPPYDPGPRPSRKGRWLFAIAALAAMLVGAAAAFLLLGNDMADLTVKIPFLSDIMTSTPAESN